MPFFQWKDSFNIGIAEIDRQHRSFLELINEYYDSASGGTKDQISDQLIVRIRDYATMHFKFEERLMRESGYEGLENQVKQHRYFESMVSRLEIDHREGKTDDLKRALPLLKDWFLRHILEVDTKYVPCLKPPGPREP